MEMEARFGKGANVENQIITGNILVIIKVKTPDFLRK
jgi:hypothetical protein